MSSALGHVRNFVANQSQNGDAESANLAIQRFVVRKGSEEETRRKEARRNRFDNFLD